MTKKKKQSNLIRKSFNLFYKQLYFSIKRTRKTKIQQISKRFHKRMNLQPNCINPSCVWPLSWKLVCQNRKNLFLWLPDHKNLGNSSLVCIGGNVALQGNCSGNNLYIYLICDCKLCNITSEILQQKLEVLTNQILRFITGTVKCTLIVSASLILNHWVLFSRKEPLYYIKKYTKW